MEMGIEFLAGAMAGATAIAIIAAVIAVGKSAMRKGGGAPAPAGRGRSTAVMDDAAKGDGAPIPETARRTTRTSRADASGRATPSGNTLVVEKVELQERHLGRNIQEVRDLLLKLADVISHTENASGRAAVAFNTAREVIHKLDSDQGADLAEAQGVLIREIDKVLQTNATLHSELDRANRGIVEQRRQIEELRTQARIDGLTHIANRAAFDERLSEYIGLLDRANLAFTLMLLDIDHFKRVNDEHGHVNGDRILRGIATRITGSIRANDIAARYGGEEFAVILPGADLREAAAVAERVRQDIAKTNFRLDDKNLKITVSGGLAECRRGMAPEQIVAVADQALYQAKSGGRNQIHAAVP